MRFAINLPNFGDFGYPLRLAELAHEAEAAGWDGFFICQEVPSTTIQSPHRVPGRLGRVTAVDAGARREDNRQARRRCSGWLSAPTAYDPVTPVTGPGRAACYPGAVAQQGRNGQGSRDG